MTIPSTCGKSRIEFAKVLEIIDDNGVLYQSAESCIAKNKLVYKINEIIYADSFDEDITKECTNGIYVHKYKESCNRWKKY